MAVQGHSLLRLCLVCVLTAVFCLEGCRKKEGPANNNPTTDNPSESGTTRAEYANDLDRLGQLADRINRACRRSYVVVLGADDAGASGGLVSVDYGLFDKLSDDGAAVLIAEAIMAKSRSFPATQTQANTERAVLQIDEAVGRYIERAFFS